MNLDLDTRNPNRLLVLDDDEKMLALVEKIAEPIGFETAGVTSSSAFIEKYKEMSPTVAIIDLFLQNEDSVGVIDYLGRSRFKGPIILFSGFNHHFLRTISELAHQHGLHVLGTVEKGRNLEKIGMLLRTAYLGSLRSLLSPQTGSTLSDSAN